MINIFIWIATTVAMFWSGNILVPLVAGAAVGILVAAVRAGTQSTRLEQLVAEYTQQYGGPPPGFSDRNTRVGGAIGAVSGHYMAGGLIGAALDIWRSHGNERGMTPAQKELHRKIVGLQAWSPWHGLFILAGWLLLTAGAAWAVASMGRS